MKETELERVLMHFKEGKIKVKKKLSNVKSETKQKTQMLGKRLKTTQTQRM